MRGRTLAIIVATPVVLLLSFCGFGATRPDMFLDPINRHLRLWEPKSSGWYSEPVSLLPEIFSAGDPVSAVEERLQHAGYKKATWIKAPDGVVYYWIEGTSFFLDCRDFQIELRFDADRRMLAAEAVRLRNRCVL